MFRRFNRTPVFLVISLVAFYLLWNPGGVSITAVWLESAWPIPVRILATLALVGVLGWMAVRTWHSLGRIGLLVAVLFIGTTLWAVFELGLLSTNVMSYVGWIWQPIGALLLTLGLRWPRFQQAVSGVGTMRDDNEPT